MSADQFGYVIYLLLFLVLVGGALFTRGEMGRNINYLLIWAAVILVLVIGYRFYERMQSRPAQLDDGSYSLRIPYDQRAGGYRVIFSANGTQTEGVIDTGATHIVLTFEDAKRAGIDVENLSYSSPVSTANGTTHVARARLDQLGFGDIVFHDVDVSVAQAGDLTGSLLGMTLLRRFESFSANGDALFILF